MNLLLFGEQVKKMLKGAVSRTWLHSGPSSRM
jgi:hypothetical protein